MRIICLIFRHDWVFLGIQKMKLVHQCNRCGDVKEDEMED